MKAAKVIDSMEEGKNPGKLLVYWVRFVFTIPRSLQLINMAELTVNPAMIKHSVE